MAHRVLHLVDHLNENCGMSNSTINMITSLRKTGFDGEILSGQGSAFSRAGRENIRVTELKNFSKRKTPANLFSLSRGIRNYLKNNRIDLIHAHHRLLGFVGWAMARLHGIPIIHTDHNVLYGNRHTSYWGDSVITVSGSKSHMSNYFNINKDKIIKCYEFNDIDELLKKNIKKQPAEIRAFGQLARLAEQKGQKYLLKGFKKMLNTNDSLQLVIKGEGPLRADLKAQATELEIAGNVEFATPSSDIESFFEKIDCFILSSIHEGSCLALVEAAAYGVPIIATRVGAIPYYLDHGDCAVLIESHSSEEIAKGLNRILSLTTDERYEMIINARKEIRNKFDRDRQARKIADAYRNIINKKNL